MASNGFFSLAVADDISPSQGNVLYKMRNTSEVQYSILKSQEGGDTLGVHRTEGIYSKFAIVFIASLIRHEIQIACQTLDLDTNTMIISMESLVLMRTANDKYELVMNFRKDVKELLTFFDITSDKIDALAVEYNNRTRTDAKNPVRSLQNDEIHHLQQNSHIIGKKPSINITENSEFAESAEEQCKKSKGGRPKGSKDQKPRKIRSDKGRSRGSYGKN